MATNDAIARVVYERQDGGDLHSGPASFDRVGFCIGDRVFWTGAAHTFNGSGGTWVADKELAETIVARWNQLSSVFSR